MQNIERVAGTSAGAIVAILVGLGYKPNEIKDIVWSLNFKNFMDDSWGIARDSRRLIKEFGWYKGDFFRKFIGNLIEKKPATAMPLLLTFKP